MIIEGVSVGGIPAIVWGKPSEKAYIFVHGKMSSKESAEGFAAIAEQRGWQTVSFDLPEHGERRGEPRRCDVFNGLEDLNRVADMVFARWERVALFGCSLGAFYSQYAYADRRLEKCLFQSPIVNMLHLDHKLFEWFGITEQRLESEDKIPTPVAEMSWREYCFDRDHPVTYWPFPTRILYGSLDDLQSREVIEQFCSQGDRQLTVAEGCDHPFNGEQGARAVDDWLRENI